MVLASRVAPGDHLNDFEVLRSLARGGMGEVFVARHTRTGENVALKVLLDPSDVGWAVRFERECRLVARLDHPHIVASRGCGHTPEGLAWLAMELLEGESLDARLRAGPLPVSEALALAAQVCEALTCAHMGGVVHRDLKPLNLFLCRGSVLHVKVLDFGVARLADERRLTQTGHLIGTPAYMSPEQARCEREIDPRSDLWSLGAVLYECLTGRTPFVAGSPIGMLYQIMAEAPDLCAPVAHLPRGLVEVIRRCLGKSRDERYASADALRTALLAVGIREAGEFAVIATDVTHAAPAAMSDVGAMEAERRLVSAVVVRDARDEIFVRGVAQELAGRTEALAAGTLLVLFGLDQWSGDEPQRAARFARAVAPAAGAVGVATGRVLRGVHAVAGEAVDRAAGLADHGGATLDAVTAAAVGRSLALVPSPDGTARLDLRAPLEGETSRHSAPEAPEAPFVGRALELATLLRSVDDAADEMRSTAAVVLGGGGMGKSRLRREATARLVGRPGGATFLLLQCERFRRDTPFGPLRDALAHLVDPGLAGVFGGTSLGNGDPVAVLDRVRSSLGTVLAGLAATGPVVLAIDDVQWLDASSRAAIRWVRESVPDLPLAIWVFGRPEAAGIVPEIVGETTSLDLGPLAPANAEELLRGIAGEAPEVLLERAGGHPLFLEELGRELCRQPEAQRVELSALPLSVEVAQLAQIDQVPLAEREFLKRAAVFGRTFWSDAVARLGGDPGAVAGLRRANLIVLRPRARARFADQTEYAFRIGPCQEAAYGLLPDVQRAQLHARAAGWLAGRRDVAADELARHWELGGVPERAAETYATATEAAASVADVVTACAHAMRVLALTRDPVLRWRALTARDDALQITGDAELQRQGLAELDALAAADPAWGVEAVWRRSYACRNADDIEGAHAASVRAAEMAQRLGDPRWSALVEIERAMLLADGGQSVAARDYAQAARGFAEQATDPWLRARATATLAYARATAGALDEAIELFGQAAAGFAATGDRRREAAVRANGATVMMGLGRVEEAVGQFRGVIDAAERIGNRTTAAVATHNLGVALRVLGDRVIAAGLQDRAWAAGVALDHVRLLASVATERVYLAFGEGTNARLDGLVDEALRRAEATRLPGLAASAQAVALRAATRRGDLAPALWDAVRTAAFDADEGRLELEVALWEASGGAETERVAIDASLEQLVARVEDSVDRGRCRQMLRSRYLIPGAAT